MSRISSITFCSLIFAQMVAVAEMNIPPRVVAGETLTISTSGSGSENFLLFGPGTAIKRKVKLGEQIVLQEETARAGNYTAILRDEVRKFVVTPGGASKINFLARPSRVPVSKPDVIIGVVFVFDKNENLTLTPANVVFRLATNGTQSFSRNVPSKLGIAWLQTASGNREEAAQFVASLNGTDVKRVVQQVAADPCQIRMRAQRRGNLIDVETEPIKDCSGNPVPDGTIVTFIQTGGDAGRSAVDARIKHGIARATLPAVDGATLTVASGVVLGNEIHLGRGGMQ